MIRYFIFLMVFSQLTPAFELTDNDYLLGGIQVNEPDHDNWVSALNHHQMNTVSITVYARSKVWNSPDLIYADNEPAVIAEIVAAQRSGTRVVFIPRVALDHAFPENAELWHGMIMPKTDDDLRTWFKNYQSYLVQWATIAEAHKVQVFALGSELKALTHTADQSTSVIAREIADFIKWYKNYPKKAASARGNKDAVNALHQDMVDRSAAYLSWAEEIYGTGTKADIERIKQRRALLQTLWKETIAMVRDVYSGALTYAANFDTYQNNDLWGDLDIMGVNAYFQLRTDLDTLTQKGLDKSWLRILAEMRKFKLDQEISDQPVIFTELGYTFRQNSSVEPWSYGGRSIVKNKNYFQLIDWDNMPEAYEERVMCLTALQRAAQLPENSFLRGILYWKLSTLKQHDQIENFVLHIAPDSQDQALEVLKAIFVR